MTPIVSIVGHSGSGKTTLIIKLIGELRKRGYRVGTVKHAHHGINMDIEGKDSWLHKSAGAETVLTLSPGRLMLIKNTDRSDPDSFLPYFEGLDLVLAEGFKKEAYPKIEVYRSTRNTDPLPPSRHLIAFVTDAPATSVSVPCFHLEDITPITDFIEKQFLVTP